MKKRVLKGETDVTQGQNKMLFQRIPELQVMGQEW